MAEKLAMSGQVMSLDRNISLLKQSENLKQNDPFYNKILK